MGMDSLIFLYFYNQTFNRRGQLLCFADAKESCKYWMRGLFEEPRQRISIRGVSSLNLLCFGKSELIKEDNLQLLGRADIEFMSCGIVRILSLSGDFCLKESGEVFKTLFIDSNSSVLH